MAEGRTLTKKEAEYFHEKYGADFEYDGMEEYNDSIGVYAQLNGRLKPMSITMYNKISDERPVLDLGQNVIKGYVKDFMGFLKKPFGDREVVDSVQDYLIYNHLHAEEQFKGVAKFTIYSNKELDFENLTVNDLRLRKLGDFVEQIDPKISMCLKFVKVYPADLWIIGILKSVISKANLSTMCLSDLLMMAILMQILIKSYLIISCMGQWISWRWNLK